MGGGGNPVKKARDKVKKEVKRVSAEEALTFGASIGFDEAKEQTGVDMSWALPGNKTMGELGRTFYDKPVAEKKAAKKAAGEAMAAQEA